MQESKSDSGKNPSDIDDTTRFFANTLHEIRTPIQTIIGSAQLMKETSLDKVQTEYLRQILFSAEGLLEIANNMLDLAKMNQNSFQIETMPFDISLVAEHLADSEGIKAFNKGVELVLDISAAVPALVNGDSMRVRQIMLNLIGNAVKFTNEGFIHVELDYNKKDGICFTVTDSGIGISEEKQKKLFTEYFQADISTYRLFGGTGLGLSITKNLVDRMGGSIGVKANPSGGSIFWFKLPLAAAIEKTAKIHVCKNPEKRRILIADDNFLASRSLKNNLALLGFTSVELCSEPEEAFQKIEQAESEGEPFELVFVDMMMNGGLDGLNLCFDITNSKSLSKKPSLYLLVPEGQMQEAAKMKDHSHYKGCLYKPIKKGELTDLLKKEFSEIEQLVTVDEAEKLDDSKIAEGIKILVAEDHPMNRKLLEAFLKKFGAEVYLAENGEDALDIIRNTPEICMVFMDIYMPKKNGIEATKELRAMHFNEIIIACTANNDKNDFVEYKKNGINDILVKPYKSETLKEMIEKWKAVMQTMSFEQINLLHIGKDLFIENAEEA